MAEEPREERGFRVVDRRHGGGEQHPAEPPAGEAELPRLEFSTFCLSLGTSVLYHLGVVGDPQTGEKVGQPNLPLARQTIDTLRMLREKTRGNLDREESQLLETLLYELQMRYVDAGRAEASEAGPQDAEPAPDAPREGD